MSEPEETRAWPGPAALVQSVDRALIILELLARGGEAGVTEIAAGLGVHKSTAFRLLATLEAHRLVEQINDRGQYRLGVGNLRLAGAVTARLDVVTEAREACRRLAAETRETVNITVLSEDSALYLDQVSGSLALQSYNWVGQRIPLHATSNGKVLLSELPEKEFTTTVRELPRLTDRTITDRKILWEELAEVRRLGYALAVDELEEGLTAAAAPIRGIHGTIIASMSISGPSSRLNPKRLAEIVPMLISSATEVSHRLGSGHRR